MMHSVRGEMHDSPSQRFSHRRIVQCINERIIQSVGVDDGSGEIHQLSRRCFVSLDEHRNGAWRLRPCSNRLATH